LASTNENEKGLKIQCRGYTRFVNFLEMRRSRTAQRVVERAGGGSRVMELGATVVFLADGWSRGAPSSLPGSTSGGKTAALRRDFSDADFADIAGAQRHSQSQSTAAKLPVCLEE